MQPNSPAQQPEVGNSIPIEPKQKVSKPLTIFQILIIAIIGSLGLGSISSSLHSQSKEIRPPDEMRFIQVVEHWRQKYHDVPETIKQDEIRSTMRASRAQDLRNALGGNLHIGPWFGRVMQIYQRGGNVHISLRIAEGTNLVTTYDTELHDSDPLYAVVANIAKGSIVKFTAELIPGDREQIKEVSITESGSMADPEFAIRFLSFEKTE